MIKLVIFDMDGLMFDTEELVGREFIKAAKEYNHTVSTKTMHSLLGRSNKDTKRILLEVQGQDFPYDDIALLCTKYVEEYIEQYGVPIKKGLIQLLDYLKNTNRLIAIASSSSRNTINAYLEKTNLTNYPDYIISGDEVKNSKPDPEIFIKVCEHFDISKKESLVLEDSKNGILAASNANIPVICIPDLVEHEPKINKLTYAVLEDLSKVINVIETM